LISLSFTLSGTTVYARGAFFRICADQTLRGPDGSLVATYSVHGWRLAGRNYREFEAVGSMFLRAQHVDGRSEVMGPYALVRAGDGMLFEQGRVLGRYCTIRAAIPGVEEWSEVTFLNQRD